MGLYNFQKRFVAAIEAGEKTHTIRAGRKNQDKPGDIMHLYTGLRQKGARLLGRFPCVKVEEIEIARAHRGRPGSLTHGVFIWIDGQRLSGDERDAFARRDGFADFEDMMRFWDGRLPFNGNVYHWRPAPKRMAVCALPVRERSSGGRKKPMSKYRVLGLDVVDAKGGIIYDQLNDEQEAREICAILNRGLGPEWDAVEPVLMAERSAVSAPVAKRPRGVRRRP